MNRKVVTKAIALTIAKKSIPAFNDVEFAIKLTIGTPSTIPADTPIKTFDTAFGASFSFTDDPATVSANDT